MKKCSNKKSNVAKKKVIVCVSSLALVAVIASSVIVSKATEGITVCSKDITVGEYNGANTGKVGYGYNAIKGDYSTMSGVSSNNNIFAKRCNDATREKVIDDTVVTIDNSYTKGNSYIVKGQSSSEFCDDLNAKLSNKTNASASGGVLPVSLKAYLEVNTKFESKTTTGKVIEYIRSVSEPVVGLVSWNLKENQYYDYLDDTFKNDLLTMEPAKLFNKYGTHFFTSYLLGGKLEIDTLVSADTYEQLKTVSSAYQLSVKASGTVEETDVSGDTNFGSEMEIKDENTVASSNIETDAKYYGGKDCDFKSYANMLAEKVLGKNGNCVNDENVTETYNKWLKSLEEKPALIDIYDDKSLYPLWDLVLLFPTDGTTWTEEALLNRAIQLEEAFNKAKEEYVASMQGQISALQNEEKAVVIPTEVIGTDAGYHYNRNKTLDDETKKVHSGYKLGTVYLSGASRSLNETVTVKSADLKVIFNLAEDKKNLPVGEATDVTKHQLINDYDLCYNIDGYGDAFNWRRMYEAGAYVQVKYKNMVTEKAVAMRDILEDKNKGESVELCTITGDQMRTNGGLEEIRVGIFYKTQVTYGSGLRMRQKNCKWLEEGSLTVK